MIEDTWKVIDTYFKTNPYFLTKHHLDSWNDFVNNRITSTIKVLNPFIILKEQDNGVTKHEIDIYIGGINGDEIFINKPTIFENGEQRIMFPNEARIRDLTYQTELYANILIRFITKNGANDAAPEKVEETQLKNIKIGAFPIMLHSKLCCLENQPAKVLREMGECPYDQGGYFVIDGKEKVIVAQERIALNKLFINKSKDDRYSYEALVRSTSDENPLFPKTIKIYVTKDHASYKYTSKGKNKGKIPNSIYLSCPNIKKEIPLFVIFKALGVESDKQILEYILYDLENPGQQAIIEFLRYCIIDANSITSQKGAMEYIRGYVEYNSIDKVKHILINDIFPNIKTFRDKALFLGHLINRLTRTALGIIQESDRDNYVYKRVDISGFLFGNLFRDYYNQFRNSVRSSVDRQYLYGPWRSTKDIKFLINKTNAHVIFQSNIIEEGFKKSLKGSWGKSMVEEIQDLDSIKQEVVQDLARISYMGFISHLRRVNTPIDPTSKIVAPHRLHPSQWGIMCPIESPDGASIGLLKHFAIMCNITFDSGSQSIARALTDSGLFQYLKGLGTSSVATAIKVLINSTWVGITYQPNVLFKYMKLLKRNGFIDKYVSISWDIVSKEINISTESGRCVRPIYVVRNGNMVYKGDIKNYKTWDDLFYGANSPKKYINPMEFYKTQDMDALLSMLETSQAPLEYIDVEEANGSLVAMFPKDITPLTTHCEIHPSTILSAVSQNIPLLNHNQAPRNIFFGAQGKQAVGMPMTNFNQRIDTMSYVLHYPQKQLVNTRYKEYMHNNILTGGENLIVAISTWTGYNQEDSIIINKSSIERGMFNMSYFKSVIDKEDENKKDNERIIFMNPLKAINEGLTVTNMKFAKYKRTLDDSGFPRLNVYIAENDAIVGKTVEKVEFVESATENIFGNKVKQLTYADKSLIADKTISGIVDKVIVYDNAEGHKTCKIRLRKVRIPELGDKMASCHGQKGVVGMILPPENMPFSKDGLVPDIIVNPHAFPSRMTIGHLLECILAKGCVMEGMMIDATPFNNYDFSDIHDMLETKYEMDRFGNELLYNGRTGEQIETEIFFGPTYYQRLKHMVSDKINYRMTGPVTATTRQPTKGRGNNGGLRIGEMERDSILSHGMSAFLKESLVERSDKYEMPIDVESGDIAIYNSAQRLFKPRYESETNGVTKVKTPYAFKLFLQEMRAMGVAPLISTEVIEESDHDDDVEAEVELAFDSESDEGF